MNSIRKGLLLALGGLLFHPVFAAAQGPLFDVPPLTAIMNNTPKGLTEVFAAVPGNAVEKIWFNSEYLMWWTKNVPVTTPLWTQATNPATVFIPNGSGSLASADTRILLGGQNYSLGERSGGRFTAGMWLDSDRLIGLESSYLFLTPQSTTTMSGTNGAPGTPILGFPFFNAKSGQESFINVAVPGFAGNAFLRLSNQLQGGEMNVLGRLFRSANLSVSGLAGFRYLYFKENLDFGQGDTGLPPSFAGISRSSIDHFQATNNFYGANLGLRTEYRLGNLFVNATGKCALGAVNQNLDISGATLFINPGPFPYSAGTFADPTNIGSHTRTNFAVVPEFNCNLGYDITRHIRIFAGYTFLYINNVSRPGSNIDHALNPTIVPNLVPGTTLGPLVGPAVPAVPFNRSDFFAQGLNFGVALRW